MTADQTSEISTPSAPYPSIEIRTHQVLAELPTPEALSATLASWSPGEIAAVIETLPLDVRPAIWTAAAEPQRGEILPYLGEQARSSLLEALAIHDVTAAAATLETSNLTAVVDEASVELREAILESLPPRERAKLEEALAYPADSAGHLMERDWVAVRADVRLEVVKRYLQLRGSVPHRSASLMVVDRRGRFLGKLSLAALLTQDPADTVAEVMDPDAVSVHQLASAGTIAALFQQRELIDLPVVDDDQRLLGRIVLDDAISLIRNQTEQPLMHMAGLEVDEDLLAPIAASARRRMTWLGINLTTAFLAAWVIGLFEAALDQIVALAVLMPIVASMGGIAGSQTLTLAIRGLALGQITNANARWLAQKEITISLLSGVVWSLVVGCVAWLWFQQVGIAVILGIAMIVNLFVAAVSGLVIPLLLKRVGQDPAISGAVILTTVTDVVGFVTFLGLATLVLLK